LSSPSTFTVNLPPSAPTLTQPTSGQTGVSVTPELRLYSTDASNDYLNYKIYICSASDSSCASPLQVLCQVSGTGCTTVSQTGWSSQSANSGAAYTSGQTAIYKLQTALSASTQYYWQAFAIDPGGSNTYSSGSSIGTFTTGAATRVQVNVGGGTTIYGGTTINP
ncbi:MAG TPA: hypothetical protein VLG13_00745, partial [Patescibacteria group bacterium]|nr:hypothetical protein [Patescibacteria group bacterium]